MFINKSLQMDPHVSRLVGAITAALDVNIEGKAVYRKDKATVSPNQILIKKNCKDNSQFKQIQSLLSIKCHKTS